LFLFFFDTTPISRFWRRLLVLTTAYNIKVLVSGYHSIDMHFIVLPVKIGGGLSMSVQRNEQLFFLKKKGIKKFTFSKMARFC
jgi:hypothetical protein